MECHDEVLAEIQQEASRVPEGDTVSITDPYAASISVNSNLLIAQFCASRESYKEINIQELQRSSAIIRMIFFLMMSQRRPSPWKLRLTQVRKANLGM